MSRPTPNLLGKTFGQLTVLKKSNYANHGTHWLCECSCGTIAVVRNDHLKSGRTVSCGCVKGFGISNTVEYNSWRSMLQRCYQKTAHNYYRYGGRGITVCERWRNSFDAFFQDMGEKPAKHYSLDRVNNDGNYEPGNCKWSTPEEQANNRVRLSA